MADKELRLKLNLANPELLRRVEFLTSGGVKDLDVNLKFSNPEVYEQLKAFQGTQSVTIVADSANVTSQLEQLEARFKSLQDLSVINIKLDGDPTQNLSRIQKELIANIEKTNAALVEQAKIQAGLNPKLPTQSLSKDESPQVLNNARALSAELANQNRLLQDQIIIQEKIASQRDAAIYKYNLAAGQAGAPSSNINEQRIREEARADAIRQYQLAAGQAGAPFSPLDQPRLDAENALRSRQQQETLRRLNLQERVGQRDLEEDISNSRFDRIVGRVGGFVRGNGFNVSGNRVDTEIAEKIQLQHNLQQSPNLGNLTGLDFSQLGRKNAITQLGFAALTGGPGGFAGGALGGAALGPEGILLGSALGTTAFNAVAEAAEKVVEVFKGLESQGIEFEHALTAVAGVLAVNSRVIGSNGEVLPIEEQIRGQEERARQILLASRSRLLPIGIGGESAATLTSAVAAGSGQRGFNLSPDQIAQVSQRFGAAAAAINPQLLNNPSQLRRDVEDIILGLPQAQRTALGATIRRAVSRIKDASSDEDFLDATKSLDPFVTELSKSDLASVQQSRLSGAAGSLQTNIGTNITSFEGPVLKPISDLFASIAQLGNQLSPAADAASKSLGQFTGSLLKLALIPYQGAIDGLNFLADRIGKFASDHGVNLPQAEQDPASQREAILRRSGITPEDFSKASQSLINNPTRRLSALTTVNAGYAQDTASPLDFLNNEILRRQAVRDRGADTAGGVAVGGTAGQTAGASITQETLGGVRRNILRTIDEAQTKLKLDSQANDFLKNNPGNGFIDSDEIKNAKNNQLSKSQREQLQVAIDQSQRDLSANTAENLNNAGTIISAAISRLNEKLSNLPATTIQEKINRLTLEFEELPKVGETIRDQIEQAQKELEEAVERGADATAIQAIKDRISEFGDQLKGIIAQIRTKIFENFNLNIDKALLGVDTDTLTGQRENQQGNRQKQLIDLVNQGVPFDRANTLVQAGNARDTLGRLSEQSNGLLGIAHSNENFQDFIKEVPRALQDLADAAKNAGQALRHFQEDAETRKLGRQGALDSAVKAAQEAGISDSEILGHSSFGSGTSVLNALDGDSAQNKRAQLLDNVRRASRDVAEGPDEDKKEENRLKRTDARSEEALANAPRQFRDQAVTFATSTIDAYKKFAGTPLGDALRPDALNAIGTLQGFNEKSGLQSEGKPEDLLDAIDKSAKQTNDGQGNFTTAIDASTNSLKTFQAALDSLTEKLGGKPPAASQSSDGGGDFGPTSTGIPSGFSGANGKGDQSSTTGQALDLLNPLTAITTDRTLQKAGVLLGAVSGAGTPGDQVNTSGAAFGAGLLDSFAGLGVGGRGQAYVQPHSDPIDNFNPSTFNTTATKDNAQGGKGTTNPTNGGGADKIVDAIKSMKAQDITQQVQNGVAQALNGLF